MTLRATRHVAPLRPAPQAMRWTYRIALPTEAACRACEWLGAMDRCCHPRHGCPRGSHRERPWTAGTPCPESLRAI